MKITRVAYGRGAKVNVGNFESIEIRVEAEIEVADDDDVDVEADRLVRWVRERVREDVQAIQEAMKQ